MKAQERIAYLEAENKTLREQVSQLQDRLAELEGQLAQNSRNSHRRPASDGLAHKRYCRRVPSEKTNGGQPAHPGRTLKIVQEPDSIVKHRPKQCTHCQQDLSEVTGEVIERRQVYHLPPLRLVVREHQIERVKCAHCCQVSYGSFPSEVSAPAKYGPDVRALAVYLQQYQLIPSQRTCEALCDLYGCEISEGTLARWITEAAERLEETMEKIGQWVSASQVQHADETGVRLGGKHHWLHVNSTRFLTHLACHPKHGYQALEAIGIWPRFRGRAMRDRWVSHDRYRCAMSNCAAHLLRELTYLEEQEQQDWAGQMKVLLLEMHAAADEWRKLGASALPPLERDEWVAQYFEVLSQGFASQPVPVPEKLPKRGGRRKQTPAKNLLDDLLRRAEQILIFLDDLALPSTNNQAERDLRMVKVQQKISRTFRSEAGLTAFCHIRSYLSSMRKQGHAMLVALAAVFAGHPLPVAWKP
jgi:transposase